jgi:O-antigen ligase
MTPAVQRVISAWLIAMAFCFPISIALSSLTFFPIVGLYVLGAYWTFRCWPPRWGRVESAFLVFWGISLASACAGVDPWHSRIRLEKDLYVALLILLGSYLHQAPGERPKLLRAMVWGGLVTASFALIQVVLHIDQSELTGRVLQNVPSGMAGWPHAVLNQLSLNDGRATGLRSHPLTFAETLLFPLAYMLSLLSLPALRSRGRWALATGVLVLAFIFSQSRGPWIAFGVMGIVLVVLEYRSPVLRRVIPLVAVPLILLFAVPSLRHRVLSIGDTGFSSNTERLQMWKVGYRIVKDHPLLGIGPGNTHEVSALYQTPEQQKLFGPWGHLHNTFMTLAAERGILGLTAFLMFLSVLGGTVWKAYRNAKLNHAASRIPLLTALLGLAGWLVSGITEAVYNDTSVLMVFYLVMGIALANPDE